MQPAQGLNPFQLQVLGSDPLSEGVLPTLRHASEHLLAPGGELVPARLVLRAALAAAGPVLQALPLNSIIYTYIYPKYIDTLNAVLPCSDLEIRSPGL